MFVHLCWRHRRPFKVQLCGRRNTTVPDAFDVFQHRHEIQLVVASEVGMVYGAIIALVLITILNDGCIVAISRQRRSWAKARTGHAQDQHSCHRSCLCSLHQFCCTSLLAMENGTTLRMLATVSQTSASIPSGATRGSNRHVLEDFSGDFDRVFKRTNFTSRRPGYALLRVACVAMACLPFCSVPARPQGQLRG